MIKSPTMKQLLFFFDRHSHTMAILLLIVSAYFFLNYDGKRQERRIEQSDLKIEKQIQRQDSLLRRIDSLSMELQFSARKVAELQLRDQEYLNKITILNQSLIKLNNQYEKALSFVDHYTSDSIRLYFSNLR